MESATHPTPSIPGPVTALGVECTWTGQAWEGRGHGLAITARYVPDEADPRWLLGVSLAGARRHTYVCCWAATLAEAEADISANAEREAEAYGHLALQLREVTQ